MMELSSYDIARMIDISAVRANSDETTIKELAEQAQRYRFIAVETLPCMTPLIKNLLEDSPEINIGGNVGFPSGGQATVIKVAEARDLIEMGCSELDVVINISKLISGRDAEVLDDLKAVVDVSENILVKVILECHYLNNDKIRRACDLCIESGADFVKTGTGWAATGATLENIALIKSHVGNSIAIKASGGIRGLETLVEMYRRGACRFGIGLQHAIQIISHVEAVGGTIQLVQ